MHLMVAAIDFGTTYSGYAFSFTSDFNSDPLKIHANQAWNGGNRCLLSLKTPTCLLLDKNEKFVSFGFEAENEYANLVLDKKESEYYLFQRFKMKLHKCRDLSKQTTVKDVTGKEVKAIKVFALSIFALKDHLLKTLDERGTGVDPPDIQWVLTVPAIWTDQAKQFMRAAAEEAGIPKAQLKIALEPEAASMYCQHLPIERLRGASESFTMTKPGFKYMVIDLGGGTADITVHEKRGNGKLKELYKASGGACGGTAVDNRFMQSVMYKIVGAPVMNEMEENHTLNYLDLIREYESVKRTINPSKTGKVNFSIPFVTINKLCEDNLEESFGDALANSPLHNKVSLLGDKLRIEADFMKEFYGPASIEIVDHIKEIMRHDQVKDVSTFLLVGGFSESKMIQDAIKKAFPDVRIIIPQESELSVLKGAVIYGHQPDTIESRIIRYSYGVRTTPDFDNSKHRNDKKFTIDGCTRCADIFCSFMKAGTSVPLNHEEYSVYSTTRPHQTGMLLKIYYSGDDDPTYTDDNDCQLLGELEVTIPNPSQDERNVAVQYVFGDTELKVLAVELTSKTPCIANFKLLS